MQVPSAELALTPRLPCGPGSCDLEFHRFPVLFTPGSWPRFDRDVALFNFWANETLPKTKNRPNIGSGVAFFNRTKPARDLLTAWSEAMANPHNERAPDDQVLSPLRPGPRVSCPPSERPGAPHCPCSPATNLQVLDLLLTHGEWLKRASFGWLPTSYLRTMPSFYRGIVPVIDHDHGSAPGLAKHSEAKPQYPKVHTKLAMWIKSLCPSTTDLDALAHPSLLAGQGLAAALPAPRCESEPAAAIVSRHGCERVGRAKARHPVVPFTHDGLLANERLGANELPRRV
jgi:hypothetical protein